MKEMDHLSSLDLASEFFYPLPPSFSRPVTRIQFWCTNGEDTFFDTAKEGLCPFKVRFIVLKLHDDLVKDLEDLNIQLYPKDTETVSVVLNAGDDYVQSFKTLLWGKLLALSDLLKEFIFSIDTDKAEYQLRHFDKFIEVNPRILAFIHLDSIKFICKSNDNILPEEFEIARANIIKDTKDNMKREDIVKLHLAQKTIDDFAAKVEIGENHVTVEGFPSDVKDADLKIRKVVRAYHTLSKKFKDDTALLLTNDGVVSYCNYKLKQCVSNSNFIEWKIEDHTLYIVAENKHVAETALETIEGCIVKHIDDFSGLVLPDRAALVTFKHKLREGLQEAIILDDSNISKVVAITTAEKFEQAKFYMNDFKERFTLKTKDVKCSAEKRFYLEESQKDLFGGDSIHIEQSMEQSMKITAYLPQWRVLENTRVVKKTYGLNNKELHGKLTNRKEQILKMSERCTLKVQPNIAEIQIKDESIEKQQVDVIVNSASADLNIAVNNSNSATYWISRAAGPQALASLREKYPRGVRVGEVAKGEKGRLACKEIYHVVLAKFTDEYKDQCIQDLRRVIETCLTYAERSGYTSIAFPAIATGVNCYPRAIVATNMIDCIVNHVFGEFQTSLETIIIAIPTSNDEVKNAFVNEIGRRKKEIASAKQKKVGLIEHPQWFCEWKVDILGKTEEAIVDFVKILNTMSV